MKKHIRDFIPHSTIDAEGISFADNGAAKIIGYSASGDPDGVMHSVYSINSHSDSVFIPRAFAKCPKNRLLLVDNAVDAILFSNSGVAAMSGAITRSTHELIAEFPAIAIIVPAKSDASAHNRTSAKLLAIRSFAPSIPIVYVTCEPESMERRSQSGASEWLDRCGAAHVISVIDSAIASQVELVASAGKSGFVGAGKNGSSYMLVDTISNQLCSVSANSLKHSVDLAGILGHSYMCAYFPAANGSIDINAAANHVIREAGAPGSFDENRVRGVGVWHDNGRIIVNAGNEVFDGSTGAPFDRAGRYIYIKNGVMNYKSSATPATSADGHRLANLFGTWKFPGRHHILRLVGQLGLSYIAGLLEFRTHGFVYGENGAGKTTFLRLLTDLMCLDSHLTGCSPPGLRVDLNYSSRCVLIDEQESNSQTLSRNLEFLRKCSSGSSDVYTDTEFRKHAFRTSCSAILAGTTVPLMENNADKVRFMLYPLGRLPSGQTPEDLVGGWASEVGPKFAARMIRSYGLFNEAMELFGSCVQAKSSRAAQVMSPILAAAWLMLNDKLPSKIEAKSFADELKAAEAINEIDAATDDVQIRSILLEHQVKDQKFKGLMIADIIEVSKGDSDNASHAKRLLNNLGIRLEHDSGEVLLFPLLKQFREMFIGTKFQNDDLGYKLLCFSDAMRSQDAGRPRKRPSGTLPNADYVFMPMSRFFK